MFESSNYRKEDNSNLLMLQITWEAIKAEDKTSYYNFSKDELKQMVKEDNVCIENLLLGRETEIVN